MITRDLKVGDKVEYMNQPGVVHTVIGFKDESIAILDTSMPKYIFSRGKVSKELDNSLFIWWFNERGKKVYNTFWRIIEEPENE